MSDGEMVKAPLELWASENHKEILDLRYRVERTLFSAESEFQRIDIVETAGFGKMLFNDSVAMISERDEFVYHEMIAHVPAFVHPQARQALVIGGGDGGTVRELLKHPSIERVHLVEIDPEVVEGCKLHIPLTSACLDDPRVEVSIADGVKHVADAPAGSYDLVLVDSTDPIGPATPLFGAEFYRNVHRVLRDDGIAISQAESAFYEPEWQRTITGILQQRFNRVHIYNYTNLTYPGGLWSFSFATKGELCPLADLDSQRIAAAGLELRYYSEAMHRAAFVLPPFQAANLSNTLTPFA